MSKARSRNTKPAQRPQTRTPARRPTPSNTAPSNGVADTENLETETEEETNSEEGVQTSSNESDVDEETAKLLAAENDDDDDEDDEDDDEDDDDDEEEEGLKTGEETNGSSDAAAPADGEPAAGGNGTPPAGEPAKKKRGGARKVGKRQVFYVCSATLELKEDDSKSKNEQVRKRNRKAGELAIVSEKVDVTMPPEGVEFDAKKAFEEAIQIFTKNHGEEPETVEGPCVYRKTGGSTLLNKKKKDRIDVRIAKDAPFIAKRANAVHMVKDIPWKAMINYTEDPRVVFAFYQGAKDPADLQKRIKSGEKIHKPSNGFVHFDVMSEVEEITKSPAADQTPAAPAASA